MKLPRAVLPKKDRPWLDGTVCILLGLVLGVIVGSGIPYVLLDWRDNPPMKKVNLALQKSCVAMGRRPIEDADGWMFDCIQIVPEPARKK